MRRTLTAFLIALLALPAAAAAQPSGVIVDPESPAGTEYAIPLEEARRHGSGGGDPRAGGEARGQPLFGEGIEPAPGAGSSGAGSGGGADGESRGATGGPAPNGGGDGGPSAGRARERSVSEEDKGTPDRSAAVAVEAAGAGGGSDTLLSAGIAAVVLAIGLLVGFGLRRVLRTD